MNAAEVTSVEGETVTNAYLAPKDALLVKAPDTASRRTACAGKMLAWTGLTQLGTEIGISEFDMRSKNAATRIEADLAVDFVATAADLGYFFSNAIA